MELPAIRTPAFHGEWLQTQGFGDNAEWYSKYGLSGHNGIDVNLPCGTPVLAPITGVIEYAGHGSGHTLMGTAAGECVLIHGPDYRIGLAHLSRVDVAPGDVVKQGQQIGLSGATGAASGCHLHLEALPLVADTLNGWMGRVDLRELVPDDWWGTTGTAARDPHIRGLETRAPDGR